MTEHRIAFAHHAVLEVDGDFDERAPGGAITVALCGSLEHDPPCPLAPHHTAVLREGSRALVQVVFACDARVESDVRARIDTSLGSGSFEGPDGVVTAWRLLEARAENLEASEEQLARRLIAS